MSRGYDILQCHKNDGSLSASYKNETSEFVFTGVCAIRFGYISDEVYGGQFNNTWQLTDDQKAAKFGFTFVGDESSEQLDFVNDRTDPSLGKSGFLNLGNGHPANDAMFNIYALPPSSFGEKASNTYAASLLSFGGNLNDSFMAGNVVKGNGLLNNQYLQSNFGTGFIPVQFDITYQAMVFILQSQTNGRFVGEAVSYTGFKWENNPANAGVFVTSPLVNLVCAPSGSGVTSHIGCLAQILSAPGGSLAEVQRGTQPEYTSAGLPTTEPTYYKPFFHMAFSGAGLRNKGNSISDYGVHKGNLSYASAIIGDVDIDDFSLGDLSGASFPNFNLTGRDFAKAGVSDADFSKVVIEPDRGVVNFTGCDLTKATFSKETITYCSIILDSATLNFDLLGRIWSEKNLYNVKFSDGLPVPLSSKETPLKATTACLDNNDFTGVCFDYATINAGTTLRDCTLTNATFNHAKLEAAKFDGAKDLSGVKFTNAIMIKASFIDVDLSKTVFEGAVLGSAVFKGAILTGLTFNKGNKLSEAKFDGVKDLSGVTFDQVDLSGASFKGVDLTKVTFNKVNLTGAYFTGANLTGVDLQGCDLQNVHFDGATMYGTKLQHAQLQGAIFDGADLRYARLDNAQLQQNSTTNQRTSLRGTKLNYAVLSGADCSHANFSAAPSQSGGQSQESVPANLTGAFLQNCTLDNANLDGVTMDNASFFLNKGEGSGKTASAKNASFNNASMYETFLYGADFSGAIMNGVHMIKAVLVNAQLQHAQLQPPSQDTQNRSDLKEADLRGANFSGANMDSVDLLNAKISKDSGHFKEFVKQPKPPKPPQPPQPPKGWSGIKPVLIVASFEKTILGTMTDQ